MKRSGSISHTGEAAVGISPASQTLVRGLDVLEVVAGGPLALPALANRLGLARSTAHRLATALLERRYLTLVPRQGYGLGPKLLELGSCAQEQTALVRVARPYIENLAAETLDSAHLSVRDGATALLLERTHGRRRLLPALRVGERMKLTDGAVGFALLMDGPEEIWRESIAQDCGSTASSAAFVDRMRAFARSLYAYDPDDTDDSVRTVAAPVRGADGSIVAAIGLSTASQYLDDARLSEVGRNVARIAASISGDLGRPPAGLDQVNAYVHRMRRSRAPDDGIVRANRTIGSTHPARPLEAEAQPVHDRKIKGTGRADNPDDGVT